jgi:hypothetical protein
MKPAQWTAVLVLALMVGGISFVTVYLGGSPDGGGEQPVETPATLTFPVKKVPQEGEKVLTTEVHQSGHYDFWFVNDNGQDVIIGLNAKGCTCSVVETTVAPADWSARFAGEAALQTLQVPLRGLDGLTLLAALRQPDHLNPELPEGETKMLTYENAQTVPAGAIGRVRLSWRQEQAKPLATYADLWMGQRGGSASVRLDVGVKIADPLEVEDKELTLPAVRGRDLEKMEKGKRGWIVCWSLTRPSFYIKAETVHERLKAESDPVEVGEPIPLSQENLDRLQHREQLQMMTVLSGYKIPVTVRAKAKDGTPIEWGFFRRLIRLSSSDEGIEPVMVKVTGEVLGDVVVGAGKEAGKIDLGPFPRTRGAHGDVVLQTDEKDLDLELDAARVPEYLKARLSKPEETTAGHRLWKLSVEVAPNAARGEFPRNDNPVYRDSAIYVKTKEKSQPRSIRVPVLGVANDG